MTYNVFSGTLNPTQSIMYWDSRSRSIKAQRAASTFNQQVQHVSSPGL